MIQKVLIALNIVIIALLVIYVLYRIISELISRRMTIEVDERNPNYDKFQTYMGLSILKKVCQNHGDCHKCPLYVSNMEICELYCGETSRWEIIDELEKELFKGGERHG